MKISLNKQEYSRCAEFLDAKEHNICAAEIYIEYLNEHYNDITFAKDNNDYLNRFLSCLEIDKNDEEFLAINKSCLITKIDELNPLEFENDSYYKLINEIDVQNDNCRLLKLKYEPFEAFVYDELDTDEKCYAEHTPLGYFKKSFIYPAIIQNDTIWMSIIPHEIKTMAESIKNAKGRVLVLGLGLGYYLFHILSKKEVISVDVIELDKRIIDLFNANLLKYFPHQEKINIIHTDAFDYLNKCQNKYDYVFADIWHNVGDGEMLYLKIKPFENKFKDTQFDYWIERSIIAMIRRQILTVFSEQLEGYKEEDYLKAKNDNDEIINRIYFYLKDTEISSFDALHNILSEPFIKEMAKHLF